MMPSTTAARRHRTSSRDEDDGPSRSQSPKPTSTSSSGIRDNWLPIVLCSLTIPGSVLMWLSNVIFAKIANNGDSVITPARWLVSLLLPLLLMLYALRRGSISPSGALVGIVFAFILSVASHTFFASLVAFFFAGSRATRFRAKQKSKFEADHVEGEGNRTWVQVLCNAGIGTQLALVYLLDCGSGERPIDFNRDYHGSWLAMGVMSSLACSSGDTLASELGSVLGSERPRLITSGRRVPRGTNGGVTVVGLVMSFVGGAIVGLAYWMVLWLTAPATHSWATSPPQWPIVWVAGLAGLFGSLVDSVLGATVQWSGETPDGKIVEMPGERVAYISGSRFLNNHSVNMFAGIVTALVMPMVAAAVWPN